MIDYKKKINWICGIWTKYKMGMIKWINYSGKSKNETKTKKQKTNQLIAFVEADLENPELIVNPASISDIGLISLVLLFFLADDIVIWTAHIDFYQWLLKPNKSVSLLFLSNLSRKLSCLPSSSNRFSLMAYCSPRGSKG